LPETLKFINWIDFAQQDFDKQFPELIQTLELDREHAHQHTILQQRANEWLDNQESHDFLLNISACENAELWLEAANDKQPRITELQERYIKASREAIEAARRKEQRRQRIVLGSVLMGLVIALGLAGFAWDESIEAEKQTERARKNSVEAERQRKDADEQRKITRQTSRVNKLVHISDGLFREGDYTRALRVAQETYQEAYDAQKVSPEFLLPSVELVLSNAYNKIALGGETLFYQKILQHDADVENALYSPDGLSILTASRDGSAQLWDNKGKKLEASTLKHGFWVKNAAFSPDGKYIATVRDARVRLWDSKGNEINIQTDPIDENTIDIISAVAFSPDSQYLAGKSSNKIRLWNINGELLKFQQDKGCKLVGQFVGQVVFSPNGQYIATASNSNSVVKIWKSKNLELFDTVKFDTKNEDKCPTDKNLSSRGVTGISFTPDGERLITTTKSRSNGISIFTLKDKKLQAALNGHDNPVYALAVAPDGKSFASGDSMGKIIIWDMDGKIRKRFIERHHRKVNELSFADSKTLLSASDDRTAKLWDLEGTLLANYSGHQGKVKHAHISPNGQFVLTASADNTARLWPIRSTTSATVLTHTILTHKAGVVAAKFLPSSQQLITAANDSDLSVQRWDRDKKTMLQRYEGYDKDKHGNKRIYSLDLSPDGKQFLTTGTDYIIRVRNVEDGKIIYKWDGEHRSKCSVYDWCGASYATYSKDGNYIITGDYAGDIAIWTHTGEFVNRFHANEGAVVQGIAISPDQRYIATASDDNMVRVWDFFGDLKNPPFLHHTLTEHDDTVWAVEFSADGKYLASASEDRTANIWQLDDGTKKPIRLSGHSEAVLSVHFDPNNEQLITSSKDKTSKVWSLKEEHEGELVRTLEGHTGAVTNAAFADDGSIATTSEDKTVYIWPSTQKIYEWAKNNKDIYQLTDADRKELGMTEEE
jgi:WD40 repeat protein